MYAKDSGEMHACLRVWADDESGNTSDNFNICALIVVVYFLHFCCGLKSFFKRRKMSPRKVGKVKKQKPKPKKKIGK